MAGHKYLWLVELNSVDAQLLVELLRVQCWVQVLFNILINYLEEETKCPQSVLRGNQAGWEC